MSKKNLKSLCIIIVCTVLPATGYYYVTNYITKLSSSNISSELQAIRNYKIRKIEKNFNEWYEGLDGFNINDAEKSYITNQGGAPTYGEIEIPSMDHVLSMLNLGKDDVFYDLGSGIGKFVVYTHIRTPAKKCIGIELSKSRYSRAKYVLSKIKDDLEIDESRIIEFVNGNITEEDISDATAIFMCSTCFSEELIQTLTNRFIQLKPGLQVVTLLKLTHPRLKLIREESLSVTWSKEDGSPFWYYTLMPEGIKTEDTKTNTD